MIAIRPHDYDIFTTMFVLNTPFKFLLANEDMLLVPHHTDEFIMSSYCCWITCWIEDFSEVHPMLNNSETKRWNIHFMSAGCAPALHSNLLGIGAQRPKQWFPLVLSMSTVKCWLVRIDSFEIAVYCIYFFAYLLNNELLFPFVFAWF